MPIPQVNDRIKEAPVVVLRAVFAGIGQLLLTADKVRTSRAAEQDLTSDQPAGPGPAGPSASWAATATKTAPATTKSASGAKAMATTKPAPATTATTKRAAKATAKPTSAAKVAATAKPAAKATAKPAAAKAAATPKPASGAKAAPAATPLPGYDDLSLPSLRARLRTLDATSTKAMLDYEKAHARRDDVISMLERRLAKITAE